jgi:aminoacyl tRNA synthase complex-interacting multifunctional protein 1
MLEILALPGDQYNTLKFILDFLTFHAPVSATLTAVQQPFAPVSDFPFVNGVSVKSVSKAAVSLVSSSPLASVLSTPTAPELDACTVETLNEQLKTCVFLTGHTLTVADLLAFPKAREFVASASVESLVVRANVVRWFDHVQHLDGMPAARVPVDVVALTTALKKKKTTKAEPTPSKSEKVAKPSSAAVGDAREVGDFSRLEIVVGKIVKVWPHPEAERLWCEEIDCGPKVGVRKIASGLREHYKTEGEVLGRQVLVLANLKARALRGFESHGMVLCASKADLVEFLEPPKTAKPGDCVVVEGFVGEPDGVLNPKKNPFDLIVPDIATNADGVACFKGIAWKIGGEVVTTPTAKLASIH